MEGNVEDGITNDEKLAGGADEESKGRTIEEAVERTVEDGATTGERLVGEADEETKEGREGDRRRWRIQCSPLE